LTLFVCCNCLFVCCFPGRSLEGSVESRGGVGDASSASPGKEVEEEGGVKGSGGRNSREVVGDKHLRVGAAAWREAEGGKVSSGGVVLVKPQKKTVAVQVEMDLDGSGSPSRVEDKNYKDGSGTHPSQEGVAVQTETAEFGAVNPEVNPTNTGEVVGTKEGMANSEEGKKDITNPEEGKEGVANPKEGKEGVANPKEGKEGMANSEEGKEGVANSEEGKEGVANSEEGKEGVVNSEDSKEGVANIEEGKEDVANSEEGKEGVANCGEGQCVTNCEENKEGGVNYEEGKEGVAKSEEGATTKEGMANSEKCAVSKEGVANSEKGVGTKEEVVNSEEGVAGVVGTKEVMEEQFPAEEVPGGSSEQDLVLDASQRTEGNGALDEREAEVSPGGVTLDQVGGAVSELVGHAAGEAV